MGIRVPNHDPKHDPKDDGQDQKQDQDNKQAQLQGEAQGQLQGQAQGQAQLAVQALYQESDNKNDNKNENENKNENKVDNDVDNKVESKVDNDVDNKVENKIDNDVENKVENKVDVDVKVDVDLGIDSLPSDDDLIDIEHLEATNLTGAIVNFANDIYQDVHGDGNDNAFNIQQVNTLVDNDQLGDPKVSYSAGGGGGSDHGMFDHKMDPWGDSGSSGGFSMWADAKGGHTTVNDIDQSADTGSTLTGGNASADAVISQEAFTQNIVQGANIQFNSADITVVGDDATDHIL